MGQILFAEFRNDRNTGIEMSEIHCAVCHTGINIQSELSISSVGFKIKYNDQW